MSTAPIAPENFKPREQNDDIDSLLAHDVGADMGTPRDNPALEQTSHTVPDDISSILGEGEIKSNDVLLRRALSSAVNSPKSPSIASSNGKMAYRTGSPIPLGEVLNDTENGSKISAYAKLNFENYTFYVQTLQVILGRKVEGDLTNSVDVHLGDKKAISRKHVKIFYNFGTQRFELSVMGRNGAFIDDSFVETGVTLPLRNGAKVQIADIFFKFVLPTGLNSRERQASPSKALNPSDAISLKTSLYETKRSGSTTPKSRASSASGSTNVQKPPSQPLHFNPSSHMGFNSQTSAAVKSVINSDKNLAAAGVSQAGSSLLSNSVLYPHSASSLATTLSNLEAVKAQEKKKEKPKKQPKQPKKVYTLEEIPVEYRAKPACSYSTLIAQCLRENCTERGMSLSEIYKSIQDMYPYYKYCPDGWQSSVRHNLSLNKSFRKVSKEGKGWLWGLDEEYCAEREKIKRKQMAIAAVKTRPLSESMPYNMPPQSVSSMSAAQIMASRSANEISQPPAHTPSIQAQLAENRAKTVSQSPPKKAEPLSNDTMKALGYLQKELIRLTKDRKIVDKATTTAILTQALAMTIAQVNQACRNAGIQGNPLPVLIERNPQQVTKILSAALNAATIQVNKKKGTPQPTTSEPLVAPKKPQYYSRASAPPGSVTTTAHVLQRPTTRTISDQGPTGSPAPVVGSNQGVPTTLDPDLEDPEFDKMVESLSREVTPGTAGSADVTELIGEYSDVHPGVPAVNESTKRSLDETEDVSSKILKTE